MSYARCKLSQRDQNNDESKTGKAPAVACSVRHFQACMLYVVCNVLLFCRLEQGSGGCGRCCEMVDVCLVDRLIEHWGVIDLPGWGVICDVMVKRELPVSKSHEWNDVDGRILFSGSVRYLAELVWSGTFFFSKVVSENGSFESRIVGKNKK